MDVLGKPIDCNHNFLVFALDFIDLDEHVDIGDFSWEVQLAIEMGIENDVT